MLLVYVAHKKGESTVCRVNEHLSEKMKRTGEWRATIKIEQFPKLF